MIDDIITALEKCGYDVSTTPLPSKPDRKIEIVLDDLDLDVSDSQLYTMWVTYALKWTDTKPLEIPGYIKTLCEKVERYLYQHSTMNRGSFRWSTIKMDKKTGTQYDIVLKAQYLEDIQI